VCHAFNESGAEFAAVVDPLAETSVPAEFFHRICAKELPDVASARLMNRVPFDGADTMKRETKRSTVCPAGISGTDPYVCKIAAGLLGVRKMELLQTVFGGPPGGEGVIEYDDPGVALHVWSHCHGPPAQHGFAESPKDSVKEEPEGVVHCASIFWALKLIESASSKKAKKPLSTWLMKMHSNKHSPPGS